MRKKGGFCFVAVAYGGEASIPNFEQADTFWAYYLGKNRILRRELLSLPGKQRSAHRKNHCLQL